MNQRKHIDYWRKSPSLFQHVGIFRTLGGFQPLQERKFGKLLFDNPPGSFGGNMTIIPTYEGKFAYFPGGEPTKRNDQCDFTKSPAHNKQKVHRCWFWGKEVGAGDHLLITFSDPNGITLKGVFAEFGHPKHPKDLLDHGAFEVAAPASPAAAGGRHPGAPRGGGSDTCGPFFHLAPVEG